MNNITIGQYIPGNSWLHKLDPRIKITALMIILVSVFMIPIATDAFVIYILLGFLVLTMLLIMSSSVPLLKVINGLKPVVFLLTFTVVVQILYVQQGQPLYDNPVVMHLSWSSIAAIIVWLFLYQFIKKRVKIKLTLFFVSVIVIFLLQFLLPYGTLLSYDVMIYDLSLIRALFIFLRIAVVIMITSLLTFTTMTTELNYGLESLLHPLKKIKVPVDVITMMISLTLRFIPTLLVETDKIMKAQASRGVDFNESKFKDKVNQIISLLVPVFVISFKRSEDLANAMEVRGYVIGQKRTRIDTYKISLKDYVVLSLSIVLFFGIFWLVFLW
jgi:energy-coupling factor transport system permease protein